MSSVQGPRKIVYRDSRDGQFVTREFAEDHPRVTEKERVRTDPPPKKPSK